MYLFFFIYMLTTDSKDKQWMTNGYKQLIKERQNAKAWGVSEKSRTLRNRVKNNKALAF